MIKISGDAMRTTALAIAALLAVVPAAGASHNTYGVGALSCAHWQSSRSGHFEGAAWILGYVSGINTMLASYHSKDQIDVPDGDAVVGEADKFCSENPSRKLEDAIQDIIPRMMRRRQE